MVEKKGTAYPLKKGQWAEISVLQQKRVKLGGEERTPFSVQVSGKRVVLLVQKLKYLGIDITDEKKWIATLYVNDEEARREILSFVNGHWN
jgi:phosphopantetheinyl transferase